MAYNPPIEIEYGEPKIIEGLEDNIMYAVEQAVEIRVHKEDLLRALQYDRHQYEQGYEDGQRDAEQKRGRWISVEDALPEQAEEVWCCCYGSDIVIPDYEHGETVAECIARTQKEIVNVRLGFLGSDGWYTIDGYPMIIAPTYWMSLNKPEPPEKE